MTNWQFGLTLLTILAGILLNRSEVKALADRIDKVSSDLTDRIDKVSDGLADLRVQVAELRGELRGEHKERVKETA